MRIGKTAQVRGHAHKPAGPRPTSAAGPPYGCGSPGPAAAPRPDRGASTPVSSASAGAFVLPHAPFAGGAGLLVGGPPLGLPLVAVVLNLVAAHVHRAGGPLGHARATAAAGRRGGRSGGRSGHRGRCTREFDGELGEVPGGLRDAAARAGGGAVVVRRRTLSVTVQRPEREPAHAVARRVVEHGLEVRRVEVLAGVAAA